MSTKYYKNKNDRILNRDDQRQSLYFAFDPFGLSATYIEEKEAAHFISLDADGEQAVFDEVLLKNGFQLNYTRHRREDFTDNTIKKLRDLAEADERPFFICLERGLTTTAKWNLKHFLGNHFTAF